MVCGQTIPTCTGMGSGFPLAYCQKISTTAIWICLEQLHIKYYHPEFLKHVGNKLGKLLKVDAITRAAIRERYAQMCVQINIANPLLKRVKIGSF